MAAFELISRWTPSSFEEFLGLAGDAAICLGTAVVCGFLVGIQREHHLKPAGVRTHILVCLGSAAFVHLGVVGQRVGDLGTVADFNRLIQSIAMGIGFLGAGAIFRAGSHVHGVTTAASIWLMGAVGAAAGAGAVVLALILTLMTYFVLRWAHAAQVRHDEDEASGESPPAGA